MEMPAIRHRLLKTEGAFTFMAKGLTRAEALELEMLIRRLELFRVAQIDCGVVEDAMRTMARFEVDNQ
jgi:hypothetical protein